MSKCRNDVIRNFDSVYMNSSFSVGRVDSVDRNSLMKHSQKLQIGKLPM